MRPLLEAFFGSGFTNFSDFKLDLMDFRPKSRVFRPNIKDYRNLRKYRDFSPNFRDFRTFVHRISEVVCPSGSCLL